MKNTQFNGLILIDGGPASGKNTLGKLLADNFNGKGEKAILLDLDIYVEKFCPKWVWNDEKQKQKDLLGARKNFIRNINRYLEKSFTVIAIGERFLSAGDVSKYYRKLTARPKIYLYHLDIPISLRRKRLRQRGAYSLIDLDKDQKERDEVKNWPGYLYHNVNSPKIDSSNLMKLIKGNVGLIGSAKEKSHSN